MSSVRVSTNVEQDLGQLLTGAPVVVTQHNIGPVLKKMRQLNDRPLSYIASDCSATPDTIRNLERAEGKHYVSLPLFFRYLNALGLQLTVRQKGSTDE